MHMLVVKLSYIAALKANKQNEQSQILDLSHLFKPQHTLLTQLVVRYLFQYRYIHCQSDVSLSHLIFKGTVLDKKPSAIEIQKTMIKFANDGSTCIMKVYVSGIRLVNARFDLVCGVLDACRVREVETLLPAICLTVEQHTSISTTNPNAQ
jgi:hypothetical protein